MNISPIDQKYWDEFQNTLDSDVSTHFYESFHFDDNEKDANSLAELVLCGTKRATAALLWSFEAESKALPKAGDLSIVKNWQSEPQCVIETTSVEIVEFENVTKRFAATEGEGDKSLAYWRKVHWAYFGRECKRIGKTPTYQMPVVCEVFRVVYPQVL